MSLSRPDTAATIAEKPSAADQDVLEKVPEPASSPSLLGSGPKKPATRRSWFVKRKTTEQAAVDEKQANVLAGSGFGTQSDDSATKGVDFTALFRCVA